MRLESAAPFFRNFLTQGHFNALDLDPITSIFDIR